MKSMVKLVITENESNQRLDRFLRKYMKRAPLSMIYKFIRKDIKINGKRGKEDTILNEGDELTLYIPDDKLEQLTTPVKRHTARRSFQVVYEDENILVINKPSGLLTHGDAHEKKNTLVNQVYGYLQEKNEYNPADARAFAPAPANRLDRNTSGLVIFGKKAEALRQLTAAIRERNTVNKIYKTIVCGCLDEELVLGDRLEKDEEHNKVRVVSGKDGKEALTYVYPVKAGKVLSIAEVKLVTGRTHQIRIHLANAGHPVAGDAKYGRRKINQWLQKDYGVNSQILHACRLEFNDVKGVLEYMSGKVLEAPLPKVFNEIMEVID